MVAPSSRMVARAFSFGNPDISTSWSLDAVIARLTSRRILSLDRLAAFREMLLARSDWSSTLAQTAAILFASDARAQQ